MPTYPTPGTPHSNLSPWVGRVASLNPYSMMAYGLWKGGGAIGNLINRYKGTYSSPDWASNAGGVAGATEASGTQQPAIDPTDPNNPLNDGPTSVPPSAPVAAPQSSQPYFPTTTTYTSAPSAPVPWEQTPEGQAQQAQNSALMAYQSRGGDLSLFNPDMRGGTDVNGIYRRPMLTPLAGSQRSATIAPGQGELAAFGFGNNMAPNVNNIGAYNNAIMEWEASKGSHPGTVPAAPAAPAAPAKTGTTATTPGYNLPALLSLWNKPVAPYTYSGPTFGGK